tara:strand:+ start:1050 stop:1499 length:450 start_codon:yes stop_codon:yes gene_type:complete
MVAPSFKPLRLSAQDGDDLQIVSAAFQDAVTKIADLNYDPKARRFTLAASRFLWESSKPKGRGWRTRSALDIGSVLSVRYLNLRRDAPDAVLSLLSIRFEAADEPGGLITLEFSGGGAVRLDVECVDAMLADISDPWPAIRRPDHKHAT